MPKAVIVGAGINGLATARALLARGWRVEILDRGPIPDPRAASFDRHRLIRTQYADPVAAARMPAAFAAWERLWADLGARRFLRTGVLALSRQPGDWTDRVRAALAAAGRPVETLGPDALAARFPAFVPRGARYALLDTGGGVLLADRILRDLARWLRRNGAVLRPETPVTAVDPARGSAAHARGVATGDLVVLAAGCGLPALAPDHCAGFRPHRCTVLYMDPPAGCAAAWTGAPAWVDLGGEDDLWGMPPLVPAGDAAIPLKLGYGRLTAPGDPETEGATTAADIAAIRAAYAGRLAGAEGFALRAAVTAFYLMAPGERFLLARDRRAIVLSADSGHGFKFGALTGEEVAAAIEADTLAGLAARWGGIGGPGAADAASAGTGAGPALTRPRPASRPDVP